MILTFHYTELNPYNAGEFDRNERGQTISVEQAVAEAMLQAAPAMADHIRQVILVNLREATEEDKEITITLRVGE